ncbi:MAG: aminopeptidase P family protein [Bacteroidota bacterium]|nr:aminopeptidase P family protein [Bacteroidota bacterium]
MNTTRQQLTEAEEKAWQLFHAIEERGLIIPGKTEKKLNAEIFKLAKELFRIKKFWHKRIVRAGKNTLSPYNENPPDLILRDDEILFFDFGPLFEEWEADIGKTYVIGNNPLKKKLSADVESAWHEGQKWFSQQTSVTGAELFAYVLTLADKYGWEFGGKIAGHLVGRFPHEKLQPGSFDNYIHPKNKKDMFLPGLNGEKREWILEIHFVDKEKEIGGFFEQLLR